MVGSQLMSHLVGAQVLGVADQAESSDIGAAARAVHAQGVTHMAHE
jgi:hypothetical protein